MRSAASAAPAPGAAPPHARVFDVLRARVVCDFLHRTFGPELLSLGEGVIDVAGGRGDLSTSLALSGLQVTLVDIAKLLEVVRF